MVGVWLSPHAAQMRCGGKGLLELLECFSGRWSPGQRLGFTLQQACKVVNYGAEVLDETSVEVCKSQKLLKFFESRYGPLTKSLNLPLVHLDALLTDDVS